MNNEITNEYVECSSIRIRQACGELLEIPVVDNKGVFRHYFMTLDEFNFSLKIIESKETNYGLYKRSGRLAYFICAFAKKEDLTNEAAEVMKNEFPHIFQGLELK